MGRQENRTSYNNKSLARALQILTVFNVERQRLTLAELSEILAIPKATVLRLCSTLMEYGFLRFNGEKQYSPGLKLFELGALVFASFSLRKIAAPFLIKLQEKLGKTVFLGVLQDSELVYLDKKEDIAHVIRFGSHIGLRRPPYFGMLGQMLMAHLPDEKVAELLKRRPLTAFTRKTITDETLFRQRLAAIRSQGYFIDNGEAMDGITGISAPVRDFTGNVVAAIGVGFISSAENGKGLKRIIKETVKSADALSRAMGYSELGVKD